MSLGNRALQVHSQQQSEHISLDALNHEFQEVQEQAQSTGSNSSQVADTTPGSQPCRSPMLDATISAR